MDDTTLLSQIEKLSIEEQELEESHHGEPLTGEKLTRLKAVEVQLDQCYDLLRQRRAYAKRTSSRTTCSDQGSSTRRFVG
jgi:hypothetical protein